MNEDYNLTFTPEQRSALVIPNSELSLAAWSWMKYFFDLTGDCCPNSTEIHLDYCLVTEVHSLYLKNYQGGLDYKSFLNLWHVCFP